MKDEFMEIALSAKQVLEKRFKQDWLQDFYIYTTLLRLMQEWGHEKLSATRTDIGVAAVKFFDSTSEDDKKLSSDFSRLADLYRKRARRESLGMSSLL